MLIIMLMRNYARCNVAFGYVDGHVLPLAKRPGNPRHARYGLDQALALSSRLPANAAMPDLA